MGTSLSSEEGNNDSLGRLTLLASAISGRALQVASGEPGEPAWTDGTVVFVDAGISAREQVEAVANKTLTVRHAIEAPSGRVGVWTKNDSVTSFRNFRAFAHDH